jgi:hypothetical protein
VVRELVVVEMRVVVGTTEVVKVADREVVVKEELARLVVVVDELGGRTVVVVLELEGGLVVVLLTGARLVVVAPGFGPSWKMTILTGRNDAFSFGLFGGEYLNS